MHVAIIGSGPAGTTAALLLARQGHRITSSTGPRSGARAAVDRVGVMQFHLPHGFAASAVGCDRRLPEACRDPRRGSDVVVPSECRRRRPC